MKNLTFILSIFIVEKLFAQDSIFVGKIYVLPEINRSFCTMYGQTIEDQEFKREYAQMFDSVSTFIKLNKNARFEIRSHTDSRGNDSINLKFSQRRADDWYENLIFFGVDSIQLNSIGYGGLLPRTVWLVDSLFYTIRPNKLGISSILLDETYINSFRLKDRETYELLHVLNRRDELVVIAIDD